ncbi:putative succinate dehydrogenase (quinone) [Lupinus albus]|uniref:Putative succinate dehydrogenase (Quinone) n=1 Tax=Lupinus albus TaxID=3870 RepID=A0A6A4QJP7_LUPAL|nr:putative succinate dehydrogenase (quinone) [Lupinus albus]
MADNTQGSSFLEGYKQFWSQKFSFLSNYSQLVKRDQPIRSWSSSDVEEFIASDPVHGPVLKTARGAVQFGLAGSALGAVYTAGFAWKYSKSLHGTALSFVAGGVFGWTFGHEVANHALQLYRVDTLAAEVKFLEWWKTKNGGY